VIAAEIGSEFPLRPGGGGSWSLKAFVEGGPILLLGSGREALRLLLHDAAARGRHRVAFPAFLCPALLEALHPTQTPMFLPTTPQLAPTPEALALLARDRDADVTVLVVAPYFGAAHRPAIEEAIEVAWEAGVEVVEDRSHSLFSRGAHVTAARGCASLRKWSGLADGGIAFGTTVDDLKPTMEAGGPSFDLRREGMQAKARWLDDAQGDKQTFLDLIGRGEAALSAVEGVRPMTDESRAALLDWDIRAIREARQANAHRLLHGLRSIFGVDPLIQFGEDETPLGVPILCRDRDRLRRGLIAERIYCPIHWVLPPAVTPQAFEHEHAVQDQILTLVCDQRYGPEDMDRTLHALRRIG
jgi:hypothetical protein